MNIIADLHLHSKYSRAVSQKMDINYITHWAQIKGLNLVATSDWTHPVWLSQLKNDLKETSPGIFTPKKSLKSNINFILSTEISCIYSQDGQTRRIHLVVLAPSFTTVEKINLKLLAKGINLASDGRPILGLSAKNLLSLLLEVDKNCFVIPAHVWTPWYSLYGSKSGFNSLNECFGNLSKHIHSVETGLSSDPSSNWQIEELQNRSIVSFSDAHSGPKLAREATILSISDNNISYDKIISALKSPSNYQLPQTPTTDSKILFTIEFYPEEGKYHYTGHRKCQISQNPAQTKNAGIICPVCGKPLTVGVLQRIQDLSSVSINDNNLKTHKIGKFAKGFSFKNRPPYIKLVPLQEIIAQCLNTSPATKKVAGQYDLLINSFDNELNILINTSLKEIEKVSGPRIAQAISKVRVGDISIDPGYDGQFGKVTLWPQKNNPNNQQQDQMTLF